MKKIDIVGNEIWHSSITDIQHKSNKIIAEFNQLDNKKFKKGYSINLPITGYEFSFEDTEIEDKIYSAFKKTWPNADFSTINKESYVQIKMPKPFIRDNFQNHVNDIGTCHVLASIESNNAQIRFFGNNPFDYQDQTLDFSTGDVYLIDQNTYYEILNKNNEQIITYNINLDLDFEPSSMSKKRIQMCKTCDRFQPTFNICLECGCYMPLKTKLKAMSCPIGKW